jgi:hypothetical protein
MKPQQGPSAYFVHAARVHACTHVEQLGSLSRKLVEVSVWLLMIEMQSQYPVGFILFSEHRRVLASE